jgi:hypothetical protein
MTMGRMLSVESLEIERTVFKNLKDRAQRFRFLTPETRHLKPKGCLRDTANSQIGDSTNPLQLTGEEIWAK